MSIGSASLFFVHIYLIHCHGFHVSDADRKGKGKGKGKGRPRWWIIIIATTTVNTVIEEFFIVIYEDPLAKKVRTCSHIYDACD
jgi:hypothetical protein